MRDVDSLGSRLARPACLTRHSTITLNLIGARFGIWYSARRLNLRETRVICEKSGTGEMGGDFESRFSRLSRPSRLSQASMMAVEAFMRNAG